MHGQYAMGFQLPIAFSCRRIITPLPIPGKALAFFKGPVFFIVIGVNIKARILLKFDHT